MGGRHGNGMAKNKRLCCGGSIALAVGSAANLVWDVSDLSSEASHESACLPACDASHGQGGAMIAVVIPAHNEAELVGACLALVLAAARSPELQGERVLVVADSCSDDTVRIAEAADAIAIATYCRNVGQARAVDAARALDAGARWLAFTDADTVVAPDWLAVQLSLQADAVCGTVAVEDWHDYGERMRIHCACSYKDRDGHRYIHGANLGVCAHAYQRAGGFVPLQSSEDVALAMRRAPLRFASLNIWP